MFHRDITFKSASSIDEWIKKMLYIYMMECYVAVKKEGTRSLCNSMDGPGEYYATHNKPVRERKIPYDLTHIWNIVNKINC